MFFSGWSTLFRTLVVGVLAYINLIVLLRFSGRRTLSKMNAFDLVVTVALGSTFATILLNRNVSLAEGTLALALLIGLQYLVTWSSVRAGWVRKVVTGEPALLFYQGQMLSGAMRASRVTEDEIRSAIRSSGFAATDEVEAVVLETDGSFSVVKAGSGDSRSSLSDVMTPNAQEVEIQST
nr:YetF domain-containing protein [Stutzerimonas stutzeri]